MPTAASAWVLTGGAWKRKGRADRLPLAPFAYRESLTIGAYKPDATTTGLLNDPARPLTIHEGDYTASVAGATINDLHIKGRVILSATNVTFNNCWIRGPAVAFTGGDTGCVLSTDPAANAVFRDCYLDPQAPGPRMDGFRYCGYTAKRCRIRWVVDGFGVFNTSGGAINVNILGCWVENMAKFYPDEGVHNDGTHNDAIQMQGGSNVVVRGNRLEAVIAQDAGNTGGLNVTAGGAASSPPNPYTNAGIQLNVNTGNLSNITIEDNWIYGGIIGINGLAMLAADDLTACSIKRNKFDNNQYNNTQNSLGRIGIRSAVTIDLPTTGADANVYEATGLPVQVVRSANP